MTSKLLLRIAAVIILLHALGHTIGVYTWKDPTSTVPQELVRQMEEQEFMFQGEKSTMAAFYDGLGYASSLALLLIVAILWIASSASEQSAPLSRNVLIAIFLFLILLGIDELIYFFLMAAIFSFAAALLVLLSIYKLSTRTTL